MSIKFVSLSLWKLKHRLKEPIYKNSFFLLLNNSAGSVLGFVFWIVAARLYSPSQVGVASALVAGLMLLVAFSRLGFDIGLIRFLPGEKDKVVIINSCLTITCLASLILSLIFAAGLDFWSPALSFLHQNIPFLVSFVILTVAIALSSMLSTVFVAHRRAEFSFFQNTIAWVLRIILPVIAVSAGAFGLFFSWGIGACVAVALGLFLFLPRLQPGYRPLFTIKRSVVNDMIHFSLMNYIADGLQGIPKFVLPLLVINILGAEATAYFRIAWAISGFLFLTIPMAVGTSLLAEASHDPARLRANVVRAASLLLVLIGIGVGIVFLFGDKILSLFGAAYAENGIAVLKLLALSGIPVIFTTLYLVIRVAQMRMKPVIVASFLIAALALGIISFLMPRLGLVGIGIGWTVSQAIVAVLIGVMILIQKRGWLKPVKEYHAR